MVLSTSLVHTYHLLLLLLLGSQPGEIQRESWLSILIDAGFWRKLAWLFDDRQIHRLVIVTLIMIVSIMGEAECKFEVEFHQIDKAYLILAISYLFLSLLSISCDGQTLVKG